MPSLTSSLLGVEHPRVEVRPAAVDTLGDMAAALGERAGIVLEPWQRAGLDMLLSTRPDGKWACYEYAELCSRRNGKTAMILVRALFGFLLLGETPILWTAQELKTSMRAWRDFRAMLKKLGTWDEVHNIADLGDGVRVKVIASNGRHGFERLDTNGELLMVARSKDSGRGFDGDFVFIDEAYDFTPEQQDALAPTQMARPNAQTAYASSPPLSGVGSAALYRLRERAESGRTTKLGWRDWGRPESLDEVLALPQDERDVFLDDMTIAASACPAMGRGRVTEETIRNMRDAMTDAGYAREVLGCWPKRVTGDARGWSVIREPAWRARGGAQERPGGAVCFAIGAAWPDAERVAVAVVGDIVVDGEQGDAGWIIEHRDGSSWLPARMLELTGRWEYCAVVLDKKGPGARLVQPLLDVGIELEHPSTDDAARAAGELYTAVTGDAPDFWHYNQPEMDSSLGAAEKHTIGDGWRFKRSATSAPAEAMTWARWGWRKLGRDDSPPNIWL